MSLLAEGYKDLDWKKLKKMYLEDYREFLPDHIFNFLKDTSLVSRNLLESMENVELGVKDDPKIKFSISLVPRALYKLSQVFGFPELRIAGDLKSWFCYVFLYKGHLISVSDYGGALEIQHLTPHTGEYKKPPKEGAKEVTQEFAENLLKFIITPTPLNLADTLTFL